MDLVLVSVRGFCAGVVRAIQTVEKALELLQAPIYVKHKIVHNHFVIESLKQKGAIFIDDLEEVPQGSFLVFSAHGIAPNVRQQAIDRGLKIIDATCGLVTKVHSAVLRFKKMGIPTIVIGHKDHVEVIGITGESIETTFVVENIDDVKKIPYDQNQEISVVTQTTLSLLDVDPIMEAIRARFHKIHEMPTSTICYATTNRQTALNESLDGADLLIVVGDPQSSNSVRLQEIGQRRGIKSLLIPSPAFLDPSDFTTARRVVMTSGASVPEVLFFSVVHAIESFQSVNRIYFGQPEKKVLFELPKALSVFAG
ncbi:MAG: 4-hydroxy-3-methylbut-2-enyl diphosphate reductase [Chlamydiae bacterium]|nr:4-hydroxy-3-methylbut-2-enyl diphosphate reductase [Chlamydiota bacterium]